MNKDINLQQKIDDYLFDMLSEKEKAAFEQMIKEDKELQKEVELTRQIMEGFQIKGEKAALEEILNLSSEDELREIASAAEKKYKQDKNKKASKGRKNRRFIWGLITGIAATVVLVLLMNILYKKPNTQFAKVFSEIREEYSPFRDSLPTTIGSFRIMTSLDIDSLKKLKATEIPVGANKFQPYLLASLTQHDAQKRGNESTLTFINESQINCDPVSFRVKWTPVNKTGYIYLYILNNREERVPVSKYEAPNYDLNNGFYLLEGLEKNTLYFFKIKTENKTYVFPFITK